LAEAARLSVAERFDALMHCMVAHMGLLVLEARVAKHFGTQNSFEPTEEGVLAAIERFFTPVVEEGKAAFFPADAEELFRMFTHANGGSSAGEGLGLASVSAQMLSKALLQYFGNICNRASRVTLEPDPPSLASAPASNRKSIGEMASEQAKEQFRVASSKPKGRQVTVKKRTGAQGALDRVTDAAGALMMSSAKENAKSADAEAFVTKIGVQRLATWQMLYCGGSQPVVDALESIQADYGLSLRIEKFDW